MWIDAFICWINFFFKYFHMYMKIYCVYFASIHSNFTHIVRMNFNVNIFDVNYFSKYFSSFVQSRYTAWSQNRTLSHYVCLCLFFSLSPSCVQMHRDNNFSRRRHADTNFRDHELRDGIAKKKIRKVESAGNWCSGR